jgi:hypothetical protein
MEWEVLKDIIARAAFEVLGKRYMRTQKRGLRIWNDEISLIINKKKQV